MTLELAQTGNDAETLQVYLLGTVPFAVMSQLQKRLHFDIAGDHSQAALILCEHSPLITVGRQGSRAHILLDEAELHARQWSVQWVARGGGCMIHLPGQLAIYPIFPLDRLGLSVRGYLAHLGQALNNLLADFSIVRPMRLAPGGLWVGERLVASLGVSVQAGVTKFGAYLNLDPDLAAFRHIHCAPGATLPMTSLARERRGPVRQALLRQRLLEHFQSQFGFSRLALFTDHPALHPPAPAYGTLPAARRRMIAVPGL